jgi:hypothetical protein
VRSALPGGRPSRQIADRTPFGSASNADQAVECGAVGSGDSSFDRLGALDDHVDASGLQIEQDVVGPVEHGRVLWSTDAVGEVGAVMGNDEQRTPGDQRPTGNGNGLAALLRWELQVEDDNKSLAVIGWLPVGGVGAHPIDDHASVGGHAVGLDQSDLRESPRR